MVDINSRQSITAIVYIAVIGPCVFILQPGFVGGLVDYVGFTEAQAGQIASFEMFGLAATTVLLSFVAPLVPWRKFVAICLVICVAGNLASIGQNDFKTLGILRFITGLGSGGLVSLTFTMMGLTARADRNFGFVIVWVLTYGGLGLLAMPSAFDSVGMNGILIFFAAFCASGLWFVKFLPNSGAEHVTAELTGSYSLTIKGVSLLALLVYNIGIGTVWAYLGLVGQEAGMAEQDVAWALTTSQFLGIAGAFLAVVFEIRFGRILPLAIGVLGGAASIYLLVGGVDANGYWLAVCGFNFLWNLSMPYLLAMMADFDGRGTMVVHGVSMQFLGYAIGPFLAASLLEAGGYDSVNGTAVVLFVCSAALLVPGLLAQKKVAANG